MHNTPSYSLHSAQSILLDKPIYPLLPAFWVYSLLHYLLLSFHPHSEAQCVKKCSPSTGCRLLSSSSSLLLPLWPSSPLLDPSSRLRRDSKRALVWQVIAASNPPSYPSRGRVQEAFPWISSIVDRQLYIKLIWIGRSNRFPHSHSPSAYRSFNRSDVNVILNSFLYPFTLLLLLYVSVSVFLSGGSLLLYTVPFIS